MSAQPKRILLVYPKIPDSTYWSYSHSLPFIGRRAAMPPLGLITVAAMLPDEWELRLVDENVERVRDADLAWADAVLVSAMVVQAEAMRSVVLRANAVGTPVVAGGPYPTQFYDEIEGVDHFVLGEAEGGALHAFLRDFSAGEAKRAYARWACRKGKHGKTLDESELARLREFFGPDADIRRAPTRPPMALSPVPRFDLLDIGRYGSMAVQLSRGCPFNCEFCSEPALFGHRPRLKSAEQVLAELRVLHDLGFRGALFFVDDNFIGSIREVAGVLREIQSFQKAHGYPFLMYTEASGNLTRQPALMAGLLTPMRGSELFDRLRREGRLLSDRVGGNNTHAFELAYVPDRGRCPERLVEGYRALLSKLYGIDGRQYFERCRVLLQRIGWSPTFSRPVHLAEIGMLLKSLARQSFAPYGKAYLSLLADTLTLRRSMFPEAVRLGITGHHMLTTTRYALAADDLKQSLEERLEHFRELLTALQQSGEAYQKRLSQIMVDKRRLLEDARQAMRRLPLDYRRELGEAYEEFAARIDSLWGTALCSVPA